MITGNNGVGSALSSRGLLWGCWEAHHWVGRGRAINCLELSLRPVRLILEPGLCLLLLTGRILRELPVLTLLLSLVLLPKLLRLGTLGPKPLLMLLSLLMMWVLSTTLSEPSSSWSSTAPTGST